MTAVTAAQASPNFETILRKAPTSEHTNADTLTWLLTLTEPVENVDRSDFVVSGTTATLALVPLALDEEGCSEQWHATLSGGDLEGLNATVTLTVSDEQEIWGCLGDGEVMTHPGPNDTNHNTFVVDNAKPTVTITGVPQRTASAFTATFTFDETVSGFEAADITVNGGTKGTFTETTSGKAWTLAVTPSADYSLAVAADAATDAAGNGSVAATASGDYPSNRSPVVARTLSDQTMAAGDSIEVDMRGAFTDPDGDGLTFSAASDDRGVATVTVDGGTLTVRGVAAGRAAITVTAHDGHGGTATTTFTVTVAKLVPSFGDAEIEDQTWVADSMIEPLVLPEASGGDGALLYALSPALPPSVELDAASRTVTGTPEASQAATTYEWTVTDEDGDTAVLTFTIRVDMPVPALPAAGSVLLGLLLAVAATALRGGNPRRARGRRLGV